MKLKQIEKLPKGTQLEYEMWDGAWATVELIKIVDGDVFPSSMNVADGWINVKLSSKPREVLVRMPDGRPIQVPARKLWKIDGEVEV